MAPRRDLSAIIRATDQRKAPAPTGPKPKGKAPVTEGSRPQAKTPPPPRVPIAAAEKKKEISKRPADKAPSTEHAPLTKRSRKGKAVDGTENVQEVEDVAALGSSSQDPIIIPPTRGVDELLNEFEDMDCHHLNLNGPGVPQAISRLVFFPMEMEARQRWSNEELVTHCLRSNLRALNNTQLLVDNFSAVVARDRELRSSMATLEETARSAQAQLNEVLKVQESLDKEKKQAVEDLEEERAEKKGLEAKLNLAEKKIDDLVGKLERQQRREMEQQRIELEQLRRERSQAVADFKNSEEFKELIKSSVEEFKSSDEFDEAVFLEAAEYFRWGFYACRNWVASLQPEFSLDEVVYCPSANAFDFYPEGIDAVEEKVRQRLAEEASSALVDDPATPTSPDLVILAADPTAASSEPALDSSALPSSPAPEDPFAGLRDPPLPSVAAFFAPPPPPEDPPSEHDDAPQT